MKYKIKHDGIITTRKIMTEQDKKDNYIGRRVYFPSIKEKDFKDDKEKAKKKFKEDSFEVDI
jgi:hypothetical protein